MGPLEIKDALQSFSGKRILITGHTGFKGSWLSFILTQLGAEVIGYALPPVDHDSHFEKLKLKKIMNHIEGDIRDKEHLIATLKSSKPEYVFHLAAQALVKRSYDDPVETFTTNVMGSVHLLEAVRMTNTVRSLVYITSDKCYENNEWIWGYRENDRLGGHDPYSASKAAAEIAFSAYARSYLNNVPDLGIGTTRAGNVIGGGDWSQTRIVPDCIRASQNNQKVNLRNPLATRPWQHVLEPLSGYLLLAFGLREDPKKYSGSWNFGPSTIESRTVCEVANYFINYLNAGSVSISETSSQQHEAQLLQLNCDKAHQLLNWYPRWNIDTTLKMTADWYVSCINGEEIQEVTRSQIKQYFKELDI